MNKNSGMLGLTETSHDMREIEQEAARGSERHALALEIYSHAVKKYIGAYMAEMGGVDAVIFTGGIGENSRLIRRLSCQGLEAFGIVLDTAKNEANEKSIGSGPVKILTIPTNEELAIARDTQRILLARGPQEARPEPPAEAPPPSPLTTDEVARLVVLWAKNRAAAPEALAAKLSQDLGRTVDPQVVARELKRLNLTAGPRPAARPANVKK